MRFYVRGGSQRSRGQALVEAALALPIFIFLLIGLIEGGRYVFYSHTLNNAAREGARYAIIHGENAIDGDPTGPPDDPTAADVKQAIRDAAVGFGDPDGIVILDPVYAPDNNRRGSTVTVDIAYTYTPIVPVFGSITVEAEATLVINN
jgi:Flp pilus assembly protein TadG